jgi:hypothetical protein
MTRGNLLGTLQDATGMAITTPGLWAIALGGNGARSDPFDRDCRNDAGNYQRDFQ